MAKTELNFSLIGAILFGILGWFLATLLNATGIFASIANLPAIGLFVGFVMGAFKEKLGL